MRPTEQLTLNCNKGNKYELQLQADCHLYFPNQKRRPCICNNNLKLEALHFTDSLKRVHLTLTYVISTKNRRDVLEKFDL